MHRRFIVSLLCVTALVGAGCASGPQEHTARYECKSERPFTVTYRGPETAILQMGPRLIEMQAAPSPVGQRYAGTELQLLIQTEDDDRHATLFTRGNDGGPGEIVEQCRETERD
ncbi:MliC family protein [uncultured Salinisphaera sp.]|uniref:MliC family protein n=1 Tax=uncultured Salinisphaera sp. TaxID=359372 RepID=UPI0032B222A1|tara:strand:+ start:374 stop:715 length:342 start_codon:yes stop_codon:yes gene_type:complete